MKNIFKIVLITALSFFFSNVDLMAQKFGHFNSGNFIEAMPERVAADKELETIQKQLVEEIKTKEDALLQKYAQVRKLVDSKALSQKDLADRQADLQKDQAAIQQLGREGEQKVLKRRQELFTPILNRISDAVKAVGKENGFEMIFDTSVYNAILFAADSEDITPLVKAKLGL